MSMLAEPRRKQKWTLNPRGKQWSEDSTKFGQKMLEKMGWTSGKGLGANEQGMTEHVRVSLKNDAAGIGFKKENLDKAWTEHQDSFNDFLQELQKGQSYDVTQTEKAKSELSKKSLELKSKHSRARVHYQKFIRGKDINKYSSKDIANIFGRKELNIDGDSKENRSNNEENSDRDPLGARDKTGGVVTINGGNMTDYFTKKHQKFSRMPKNKKQEETNSESEPEYSGFGFASAVDKEESYSSEKNKETLNVCNYAFENPCLTLNSPENISNSSSEFKLSKQKKIFGNNDSKTLKEFNISKHAYENGFVNCALNLEYPTKEMCDGKEFEVSRTQLGVTNSALDLNDEVNDKRRVTFNDHVEYSTDSVKKKKGRTTLDKFEVENTKIKKKKKQEDNLNIFSSGFVNEALDVEEISEELNDNKINEHKSKSSKKRKRNRQSNLETIVEIPEENREVSENAIKIKKLKTEEDIVDIFIPQENLSSKKMKKKKKIKKTDKEIVTVIENDTEVTIAFEKEDCELHTPEDQDAYKEKKKRKKKNIELNVEKDEDIIAETEIVDNEIQSKKKEIKNDVDISDSNTDLVNMKHEKEISNKENANVDYENTSKVKKPKKNKRNKSMEESTKDSDDSTHHIEPTKEEPVKEINATSTKTPSISRTNEMFNTYPNSRNENVKMSRRLLMSFFHKEVVIDFPGSNIHEIKGYGDS
ncbi:probable WRKY transcription factor protein 1 [Colletes gigas]|uniref:probable WRKY transcription factor protein 1 n=1 Tax=Colletes gigas TaxID=935657 RepID=UPI001C9BA7D6|nr:probable WRKY transcription factor protein 1 [Colletes gigas]